MFITCCFTVVIITSIVKGGVATGVRPISSLSCRRSKPISDYIMPTIEIDFGFRITYAINTDLGSIM